MMNGHGKSDSAIVAGKPTNKAGQPAAESVEPSAEAEGNASQQSTRRAQDRESVSQALERIRQVARQRKKERFTSLFHHISVELLRVAFFALKRDAAPGVDGLTWQDYEADLDRKIEDLHARVHRGAYRALPSRRHYIPKPVPGRCSNMRSRAASNCSSSSSFSLVVSLMLASFCLLLDFSAWPWPCRDFPW